MVGSPLKEQTEDGADNEDHDRVAALQQRVHHVWLVVEAAYAGEMGGWDGGRGGREGGERGGGVGGALREAVGVRGWGESKGKHGARTTHARVLSELGTYHSRDSCAGGPLRLVMTESAQ